LFCKLNSTVSSLSSTLHNYTIELVLQVEFDSEFAIIYTTRYYTIELVLQVELDSEFASAHTVAHNGSITRRKTKSKFVTRT